MQNSAAYSCTQAAPLCCNNPNNIAYIEMHKDCSRGHSTLCMPCLVYREQRSCSREQSLVLVGDLQQLSPSTTVAAIKDIIRSSRWR